MAAPTVEATTTSVIDTASTSHTVNLPTGIVAGSGLRIVFGYTVGVTDPDTAAITWPVGYTPISNYLTERTTVIGIASAYRQADGTEGSTINVTTDVTTKSAHIAYRYAGHESFATRPPEAAATGSQNLSTNPDPPSITPTGGSKDYLFQADACTDGEDFTWTEPTNYTGLLVEDTGIVGATSTNCSVASASRALTAASEDPGVYTHGSTSWVSQTVVIHPAGAAVAADPYPYIGGGYYPHQG